MNVQENPEMFHRALKLHAGSRVRTFLVSGCVLALLVAGCQTTVTEVGTDYMLPEGKQDSILDSKLKNLMEEVAKYPKRHDLHYQIGGIYFEKEDYKNAAKGLKAALRLAPEESKYHFQLGRVYWVMGESQDAEACFREAVRLSQEDRYSGPHAALGYILAIKKDYSGAIAEFKKCAEIEPQNPMYHYSLGSLHDMRGEREEAIKAFQEYLALGGTTYRKNAVFFLEKLGVQVDKAALEGGPGGNEGFLGSSLESAAFPDASKSPPAPALSSPR
jgi:tetratricopeptide (TPR) repeat protein